VEVYITHIKPGELAAVMAQIAAIDTRTGFIRSAHARRYGRPQRPTWRHGK
jgi:hypothetical protein